MLTLEATQTLRGVAETADIVTVSVFGDETGSETDNDFKVLFQGQLDAATTTLYETPASHATLIKSIHVRNTHTTLSKWVEFFVGGVGNENSVARFVVPANGTAVYDGHWTVSDGFGQISLVGSPGVNGVNGSTWYEGTGAPAGGTGVNGDFYLNDANGDVYQKTTGTWGIVANILGPQGDTGPAGSNGSAGATGPTGPAPAGQIFLSAAGMWPSTTSGPSEPTKIAMATNNLDFYVMDFDGAAAEYAQVTVAMPSDWNAGTVTAQFYWTVNAAVTTDVVWGCSARAFNDNDALDQAWGAAQTRTDTAQNGAHELYITTATSAITVGGTPTAGGLVQYRVYRSGANGSDTMTQDARLIGVMINFTRS
jgi:hypothetical protein